MSDPSWPEGGLCLPPALALKKQKIERSAAACLAMSGFSPVELPTLEFVPAQSSDAAADRCKFVSPDGRLMALRYDHTMSVIRFIASSDNFPLPARLSYSGSVFRRKKESGGYMEVPQIGAEILGEPGESADIEIIRVLARTLSAVGVEDYLIDIGTVEVFKGIVAGTSVDSALLQTIREAILRKDESSLARALDGCALTSAKKAALAALPAWFGGPEVFDRASKSVESERSRLGLDQVRRVYEALAAPESSGGFGRKISVDLGVVQSLEYYTGTVFEAYARNVGKPIASGGRYDRLADPYRKSIPATGFALNLPLLLEIV